MSPWTSEEITGNDDYDVVLVEADTIGGAVDPVSNPPEIMSWCDEESASVEVSIPPLEEKRRNSFAETTVLLAEVKTLIHQPPDLVDYVINFEDDIEGDGEVSLREGDSFPLCGRVLEGSRDSSIGLVAEKKRSDLAAAIKSDSEISPEIGFSTSPDWVLILEITERVDIDSANFVLDIRIDKRVCSLRDGAITSPEFFVRWFGCKFHLTITINDFEWRELATHWYEMAEEREPSVVPVLISEKLWTQLDQEIFEKICQILVDEGVRAGDWVNFVEVSSRCQKHDFGGGQT